MSLERLNAHITVARHCVKNKIIPDVFCASTEYKATAKGKIITLDLQLIQRIIMRLERP